MFSGRKYLRSHRIGRRNCLVPFGRLSPLLLRLLVLLILAL
nr:MAG TPA: hypothetical protein [Caudoviricetes sp.]